MGVPLADPDRFGAIPCLVGEGAGVLEIAHEKVGPADRVRPRVASLLDVDGTVRLGAVAEQDAAGLLAVSGGAGQLDDALACGVVEVEAPCHAAELARHDGVPQVGQLRRGGGSSCQRTSPACSMSNGASMFVFGRRPITAWLPGRCWSG